MSNKKPTRQTEPAIDPAQPEPKKAQFHIDVAIADLLSGLNIDPRALKGLEVRPAGSIRIMLDDNSARSIKFTPLPRYERDRDGRIIE